MSRAWVSDAAWFEQPEPATEAFPAPLPVDEAEHQAALAEIDLPPHPLTSHRLRVMPSRWLPVLRWSSETLQVAFGASLGCSIVFVFLSLLAWLTR